MVVSGQHIGDFLVVVAISTLTFLVTDSSYFLDRRDMIIIRIEVIIMTFVKNQKAVLGSILCVVIILVKFRLAMLRWQIKLMDIPVVLPVFSMRVGCSWSVLLLILQRCEKDPFKFLPRSLFNSEMRQR